MILGPCEKTLNKLHRNINMNVHNERKWFHNLWVWSNTSQLDFLLKSINSSIFCWIVNHLVLQSIKYGFQKTFVVIHLEEKLISACRWMTWYWHKRVSKSPQGNLSVLTFRSSWRWTDDVVVVKAKQNKYERWGLSVTGIKQFVLFMLYWLKWLMCCA